MKWLVAKDLSEWVNQANAWLLTNLQNANVKQVFIPAGNTPVPLYQSWEAMRPDQPLRQALASRTLYSVDEVVTGPKTGLFEAFFEEQLPHLRTQLQGVRRGAPLDDDAVLSNTVSILGIGTNGHLAFHEPHVAPDFRFGRVQLEAETAQRIGSTGETWGLTYGVGTFIRTRSILILAAGASKHYALKELQTGQVNPRLPASLLHPHSDVTVLMDSAAAAGLSQRP